MKVSTKRWVPALLALVIYQAAAVLWFGLPVIHDLSHNYIGMKGSPDPALHMWCLAWWPYAISHHLNPFITKAVWAPAGFNLTWSTSIPFAALMSVAITQLWGPVVAYNVLCLAAPALAAWCAFILCRHACNSFFPSLVGGYLFGFSPYMLGHLLGHLSLILIFPVPLAIYLVALRVEGRLSPVFFTLLFAIVAIVQFLCSTELLATSVFFGAIAMLIAMLTARPAMRKPLVEASALAVLGLVVAAIPLIPFLYYAFFVDFIRGAFFYPGMFATDLLAFVIPAPTLLIARPPALNSVAMNLSGGFVEDTAYIGIPLLLIAIDYGWTNRGKPLARLMILALIVFALASLGPILHVAGTESIPLPWALLNRLPIIDKMLTGRFMMFAFLDLALITAIYLSTAPHSMRKWVLATLSVVSLLPNLPAGWWVSKTDTPLFFTNGNFRRYLQKDEITLVLPYGWQCNSMLWQAQTKMYFRMAGGYLGTTPAAFLRWPVLSSLYQQEPLLDFAQQMRFFLAAHDVRTILVAGAGRPRWPGILSPLHLTSSAVDDVLVYRVPGDLRAAYGTMTPEDAAKSLMPVTFAAMVKAADSYWAKSLPLDELTLWEAVRLGLLPLPAPSDWPDHVAPQSWRGLWLGASGDSAVSIGVPGSYEDLIPVIDRYGPVASQIFFPFPEKLQGSTRADRQGELRMTFDRRGLGRAALLTSPQGTPVESSNPSRGLQR